MGAGGQFPFGVALPDEREEGWEDNRDRVKAAAMETECPGRGSELLAGTTRNLRSVAPNRVVRPLNSSAAGTALEHQLGWSRQLAAEPLKLTGTVQR